MEILPKNDKTAKIMREREEEQSRIEALKKAAKDEAAKAERDKRKKDAQEAKARAQKERQMVEQARKDAEQ